MKKAIILTLFLVLFVLTSCNKDPEYYNLTVNFEHTYNGEIANLTEGNMINDTGNVINFYNFKYLISEIKLIKDDNSKVNFPNTFAFVNAIDNQTSFQLNDIEEGNYKGIEFLIGLLPEINNSNPNLYEAGHPLNPTVNEMHWDWSQGYIFFTIEGFYYESEQSTDVGGFTYHIAFQENLMPFTLTSDFNLDSNKSMILDFDIAEIFKNPNVFNIETDGNLSHSTSDNGIANRLSDNILNAISIKGYE